MTKHKRKSFKKLKKYNKHDKIRGGEMRWINPQGSPMGPPMGELIKNTQNVQSAPPDNPQNGILDMIKPIGSFLRGIFLFIPRGVWILLNIIFFVIIIISILWLMYMVVLICTMIDVALMSFHKIIKQFYKIPLVKKPLKNATKDIPKNFQELMGKNIVADIKNVKKSVQKYLK